MRIGVSVAGMALGCAVGGAAFGQMRQTSEFGAIGGLTDDHFGAAVAISGDTAVVGAFCHDDPAEDAGAAYVFERQGCGWVEVARLVSVIGRANHWFGASVAINATGNVIAIGTPQDSREAFYAGSVTIYERVNNIWTETGRVQASDRRPEALFGRAVAFIGNVLAVGAPLDSTLGLNSGSVYLFQKIGGSWTQVDKLTAPDGGIGDAFGESIAGAPNVLVIGAIGVDDVAANAGAAYVYDRDLGFWLPRSKIWPLTGAAGDNFGASVAYSDGVVVVGSPFDNQRGQDAGAVYVFKKVGQNWITDVKLFGADTAAGDNLGASVACVGDTIIAGAPHASMQGDSSGAVHVFTREGAVWSEATKLLASNGGAADEFGSAIGFGESTLLVGASYGSVASERSGAVYSFALGSCPPDVNCDGVVTASDLGLVLGAWGQMGGPTTVDVNGDGVVNASDLGLLLGGWGLCP